MPSNTRPPGHSCCLCRDRVNDEIRRLMSQPASRQRSEEWARLLEIWADTCARDRDCWTTAA